MAFSKVPTVPASRPLFLSTSSLTSRAPEAVIRTALELGAAGIELGNRAGGEAGCRALCDLAKAHGLDVVAHNHVLSRNPGLVLNLAEPDATARRQSLEEVQYAVEWCARHGVGLYTFHAGCACSVRPEHLGGRLPAEQAVPMRDARRWFCESLRCIALNAADMGVRIAVENHVLFTYNLDTEGRNTLLPCVGADDMLDVLRDVGHAALGLLLDVGHLRVSAATLGFDPAEALRRVAPHVMCMHLHDNDAMDDVHALPGPQAWFWPHMRHVAYQTPLVLECSPQAPEPLVRWHTEILPSLRASVV